MRFARLVPAMVCALLVGGCGDGSGPGNNTPASLQVVAGDTLRGDAGDSIVVIVKVVNASGGAVTGATVSWSVTSGDAIVAPASSTSDALGRASTTVVLGPTPGPLSVTAAMTGLAAAHFALGNTMCDYTPALATGVSTQGLLNGADCRLSDSTAIDFYDVSLASQQNLLVTMTSHYDGYLFLYDSTGLLAGATTENPVDSVVSMRVILGPGHWIVGTNAYDEGSYGRYAVLAAVQGIDAATCTSPWISKNIDIMQTASGTSCSFNGGLSSAEHFLVVVEASKLFTADVTPTAFTANVSIVGPTGPVATATSASSGAPVTVSFTPTATGVYFIEIAGAGTATYRMVVH